MLLYFNTSTISSYHSASQIARVLTEEWVADNMYCPRCGNYHIKRYENNKPVADFYCSKCNNEYELKSKNGTLGHKVNDGAYETMISRITSNNNPDFFFMSYLRSEYKVKDFVLIPKHFFIPDIIEKRKPLATSAQRAGWIGCNILIDKIPKQGRIEIIENGEICDSNVVIEKVNQSNRLFTQNIEKRGWLMDVLNCVSNIKSDIFSINEVYKFENELFIRHPQNNNIRAKIRQQLQFLRDKGFIIFLGNGIYKKIL